MKITFFQNILLTLPILLSSHTTLAQERPHTVGATISNFSFIDNNDIEELNDLSTFHYKIFYDYTFNRYISLGFSALKGDSGNVDSFIDWTDSKIEYDSFAINTRLKAPISASNALFLNIGVHQYSYNAFDDYEQLAEEELGSDDGADMTYAIGWQGRFAGGWGIEVSYERLDLGSNLNVQGFSLGASYSF